MNHSIKKDMKKGLRQVFRDFIKSQWKTGLDFKKEFDPEILLPNLDFDKIVEEL